MAYLLSTALAICLTMGSSQAMRTAFFDDLISIVPAAACLNPQAFAHRLLTLFGLGFR